MKSYKSTYLFLLCLSLFATNKLMAQTALPYFSGFDNTTQKAGWQMIRKGTAGLNNWAYGASAPYSGTDCIYHGYPVGGATPTDDWFVSPAFNLSSGGKLDSIRHSFSGFGTPSTGDTLAIYLLTGNADPALATSKVLIHDFRGENYNNDNTWKLTSNITLPSTAGSCYLAIRYKTTNNWLDVKFDNVRLSGNGTTGISNPTKKISSIVVFPNPSKDMINIRTKENIKEISITDINGRIVFKNGFQEKIDVSRFSNGVYSISCIMGSGEKSTLTFVKK